MLKANLAFEKPLIAADRDWISYETDFTKCIITVHPDFDDVIRPFFPPPMVVAETDDRFGHLVQRLSDIFRDFLAQLLARDGIDATLASLGYNDAERAQLASYLTPFWLGLGDRLLRFDFLCGPDGLKAVELNASAGIGGVGLIEGYDDAFASSSYREWLSQRGIDICTVHPLDHFEAEIRCLVAGCRHKAQREFEAASNSKGAPQTERLLVALVTLPRDLTYLQTLVCARYLQRPGLQITTASIFDLEVGSGGVWCGGQRVDCVWAVHSFEAEIVDAPLRAQAGALRRAAGEGLLAYLVSPSANVLGNKALFSLLLGEPGRSLLDGEDQALLTQVLPWTTIVRHENLDALVDQQPSLVLKPARGISGVGMLFGPRVGAVAWRLGLERILNSGRTYVAQRLCPSLPWIVPPGSFDPDRSSAVNLVLGGICVGGRYAGHFVRALPADSGKPINVSFGGRMAPCYVVRNMYNPSETEGQSC